jgi:hypothetical protein
VCALNWIIIGSLGVRTHGRERERVCVSCECVGGWVCLCLSVRESIFVFVSLNVIFLCVKYTICLQYKCV